MYRMTDKTKWLGTIGSALPRRARSATAALALVAAMACGGQVMAQEQQEASQTPIPDILSEWLKICNDDSKTKKTYCVTTRELRTESGQFLGSVVVRETVGEKRKKLAYSIPLGLLIQPGVNIQIDKNKPKRGKIGVCLRNGCYGEIAIEDADIGGMKKGNDLIITALNQQNKQISFKLSLSGFTAAYDGKGLNPTELQEAQQNLESKLLEKASEARKKLIEAQEKAKEQAQ